MNLKQRKQFDRLKKEFGGRCVRCGLIGHHLDKDHIKPKYQGGGDKINNIQPLCAWCNGSKGSESFNWKTFRRKIGWVEVKLNLPKTHPFIK